MTLSELRQKREGALCGGVYDGGPANRKKQAWPGAKVRRGGYTPSNKVRKELMGIDWMTQSELTQAIPPAYTEYIGSQLITYLERKAA